MLHFSRWKMIAILLAVAFGILLAVPNILSEDARKSLADMGLPSSAVSLGLDLQGGVHLQIKVDRDDIIEERLETLVSDVRTSMRDRELGQIGYAGISGQDRSVTVRLLAEGDNARTRERMATLLEPVFSSGSLLGGLGVVEVAQTQVSPTVLRYTLTDEGIDERLRSAVSQSIEVIRRRVDELGTTEPVIQRQGVDRVIVQVPGYNDPERLKEILKQTAKLTFHMVDESMSAQDALANRPPVGSEVIPTSDPESGEAHVLIEKRVRINGDELNDAQPGFDHRTNEPIVTFRFNNKASREFCKISSANVGSRFAIVLDETSISAPVIRMRSVVVLVRFQATSLCSPQQTLRS